VLKSCDALTVPSSSRPWSVQFLTAVERSAPRPVDPASTELTDWIDEARLADEIDIEATTAVAGIFRALRPLQAPPDRR
jgi:hypothetical protein